ncbi:xanthine dehydrogenase family Fe-S subunit [Pseudonocardia kunmingensis]|uniref:Carbon-monoxide dehydrogenase small subunit n=1 Tax=Pseudonocardia kunmingensis TaxID=630975 RepID=A0A543DVT7_9PSEU|nr:2Fe-2S iron-sulfur cluster-binding protein [Pseudonocardia kunmingensis]TQM13422.1 carbon-monoxide dehydrogenase small subunit [Pseudonocardia kunmingensis]
MTRPQARPEKVAAGESVAITMTVNGTEVTVHAPPRVHLADVLREQLGLTGTHLGCEHGVCGMCTVLVDGAAARACLLFAVQCDGADVVTVEGLGSPEEQHPLQQAFSAHHGLQCGFCTPGMLMSSYDLLADGPQGTAIPPEDLPVEMSGVLCRCTGYRGILAAVADVAAEHPDGLPGPRACGARTLVGRGGGRPQSGAEEPADEPRVQVPAEVRLPTGAPSVSVEVRSELAVPVEKAWEVLDDFHRLAACLPGAELVEVLAENRYRGRATVALGPVKLAFDGLAQVVEHAPDAHRLRVHAQGADTGGSTTQADIRLHAEPAPDGGTVLQAEAALFLSGRIAQFGRALAGDVSRRLFEQFAVAVEENARTGRAPATPARPPGALSLLAATLGARLRAALRRLRRTR